MVMDLVMEGKKEEESLESKYMKGVRHLCESGITRVPGKYILPVPERPQVMGEERRTSSLNLKLPVIDLARLHTADRPQVLKSLAKACEEYGFFQVVNHNIPCNATRRIIGVGRRFFEMPFEERAKYMSTDVRSPVRYGTSFNQCRDGVFCWRDFLKLSCHPMESVLPYWPSSPMDLREEAMSYAMQAKSLFLVLMGAIFESLGVDASILREFDDGSHLMVVNCYPACPEPNLTLGMPPHSDYGFLTILLQDDVEGLQVQSGGEWITVEPVPNSFVINIGDHLEIFSNGRYKSVLHRVLVNSSKSRISVASLHSLPPERMVSPSPELVNEENPRMYEDTNFAAFLDYMSSSETKNKNFLESRKLTQGKEQAKSQ
ncbi:protein DMR6-LIKE OXYGENASE 2-like [Phoenix dactylifera]|uniref:Protein DMR6-LIKE OXYGENASE 2-like n=1 Tax=Phoenix dactylifera TaxID=42345 RepID=A0A8B8ZAM7_PHODC|nr:protein DMR6-LIKE OXYGENASE 2-like [Phoenix dactylifera]